MLETFRINVIKDYLFNQLLFMHCSNKIVQYNKLVCNFYISQLLKKKEEEDMICNFLKDTNRPLTFYRLICVFVLKPFF